MSPLAAVERDRELRLLGLRPLDLPPPSEVVATFAGVWADSSTGRFERAALAAAALAWPRSPRVERRRAWLAADWLVREFLSTWLRAAGLVEDAAGLAGLSPLSRSVEGSAALRRVREVERALPPSDRYGALRALTSLEVAGGRAACEAATVSGGACCSEVARAAYRTALLACRSVDASSALCVRAVRPDARGRIVTARTGATVVVVKCGCGGRHRIFTTRQLAAAWTDRTGDCRPFADRRLGRASPFAAGSNGARPG